MSNVTDSFYNLTALSSIDVVDNPAGWLSTINDQLGGVLVPALLVTIYVVLFFIAKTKVDSDTEAWSYAGIITTFGAVFLFVIDIANSSSKLISWPFLLIIIVITAVGIFLNNVLRDY